MEVQKGIQNLDTKREGVRRNGSEGG